MGDNNSIVSLGDASKPANTLIEKISDAIGVLYEPTRIERKAKAEAKAEQIKELTNIETQVLKQRAIQRFIAEENQKQENIESIIEKAIPLLGEGAKPENIEKDWISNFFDKSKLTSDEEMKTLWANILAGESNNPGSFSKRTVNFMESLDKNDALLFTKLCSFIVNFGNNIQPLIFDTKSEIYKNNGITFPVLNHLDSIGLINFGSLTGYQRQGFGKYVELIIGKSGLQKILIEFKKEEKNDIDVGIVLFTNIGQELAKICNPEKIDGFQEYIVEEYKKKLDILNIQTLNYINTTL